jgi:hypothetical protein
MVVQFIYRVGIVGFNPISFRGINIAIDATCLTFVFNQATKQWFNNLCEVWFTVILNLKKRLDAPAKSLS